MRLLILLALASCAVPERDERPELIELVLRADKKVPGQLVSACSTCDIKREYFDLRDSAVRERLIAARFICVVGLKKFRICRILPGLCHQDEVTTGWGPWKKTEITLLEVIEAEKDHQKMVDLGTICAAKGSEVASEFFTD